MKLSKIPNRWLVIVCMMLLISGCGNSKQAFQREDIDKRLPTANNEFAFRLYQEVLKQEKANNVFLSPLSVSLALSMTVNGADQETRSAMVQALQVQDLTLEDLNRSNAALQSVLQQADPDVKVTLAHSLWGREGTLFRPDFLERNEAYYDARVTELDFQDPGASDTINEWVRKETEGKIGPIIDGNIDPDTFLFLINAIYFKGKWSTPFDEAATTDQDFHLPDGTTRTVPMMVQSGELDYYKGDNFEAVRLPYGNKQFEMTVFLPDEGISLERFYKQLNADHWKKWMAGFETTAGTIQLPRFELEYEKTLNGALKALGMEVAFDEHRADFGQMVSTPPRAYIHEVKHQSFIEVNEKGTEAAAATSVEMRTVSAPLDLFQMRVDRPFFFAIHDQKTGTLLFMGSVMEPETSSK
ncbi:serpin family protein [Desmospora profundinema]|uniref:Serpin B n=1 Tax=Desmospora profundinema TaxID=1571184 RepID=A0ABU1II79_9BACL|nr:serpin family protein [Desmospora profundinema]MDR6224473.1 serpin B [Desmospora profundinema]